MDPTSAALLGAIVVALLMTIGGTRAHSAAEGFWNVVFRIQRAIQTLYARANEVATSESTPLPVRLLATCLVRVSWLLWLGVAFSLGLLLLYGKYVRPGLRYLFT